MFYLLSLTLMISLPLALPILWRRRFTTPWWLFCVGMATFTLSQLYHLPLNNWLTNQGILGPVLRQEPHFWRTAVLLGLSAGLCESLARALGYALLFRRQAAGHWEDGLMVGLGHGGIEAMGFVAILSAATYTSLLALRGSDLTTLNLPAAQVATLTQQLTALETATWQHFLPLAERLLALNLHVILSLLVWRAFRHRQPGYFVVAVAYHTLFDFTAVALPQFYANPLLTEGALLLLSLPGMLYLWRTWPTSPPLTPPLPLRRDLSAFVTATGKELQQQWRTKRVLVVTAVFLLFGLSSPLLARYMPELFQTMPGAEQFAALIPTPTINDALTQYIKNITQFSFIIAILSGMGAVAGEKERGTAALILSKPLPRWAFVLSKFAAQATVFAAAYLLAALAAYYYTWILFAPLHLGAFLAGNGLLWLWLMVFTAVTLLGSTLTHSTGAGAGISLLGAVILLLSGSLPVVGQFAPAGLVAWASQLGLPGVTAVANGGTLVANVVIILVCLVTAVAAFEQQEL